MNYRLFAIAGATTLAGVAACTTSTGISAPRPFAFIDVRELPTSNPSGLGAFASAVFINDRVTGVVPSSALNESCTPPTLFTTSPGGAGAPAGANLDPGTVSMTLRGAGNTTPRTVALTPNTVVNGLLQYTNQSSPPLSAGSDSIFITATGQAGGFPAFTIGTISLPHFVAQPVDDSIVGLGIRVQWTPLTAASPTRMQISLQYAEAASTVLNMEVRCIALDDGDFTIPRQFLSGWQDAGVDSMPRPHQAVLSRFNTIGGSVSADGIVAVVTRVDTTIVKP